jgi:hypothetical protein
VLVADLAETLEEQPRRRKVPALALDRLHHDRRDIARRDDPAEDGALEDLELRRAIPTAALAPGADAREGRVVDHRDQRPEAGALFDLRVGQRQRAHGPAVEAAVERDDSGPARVIPSQLDRSLHGLGAGVREEDAGALPERRDRRQPLAELDVAGLVEVGRRDVDQLLRLRRDGGDHVGVRVAGRADRDARGEVEEAVAVDVGDDQPRTGLGNERVRAREGRAGDRIVALDERAGLRSGQLRDDVRRRRTAGTLS